MTTTTYAVELTEDQRLTLAVQPEQRDVTVLEIMECLETAIHGLREGATSDDREWALWRVAELLTMLSDPYLARVVDVPPYYPPVPPRGYVADSDQ